MNAKHRRSFVKRWLFFTILSLGLSSSSLAETPDQLCMLDPDKMPASWRPSPEVKKTLNSVPWSEAEAKDAEYAKRAAVEEMIDYFERRPFVVRNLWDDSIEALIQVTYASANDPAFDVKVREAALDNLTTLIDDHLANDALTVQCDDFADLLPLAIFSHNLHPAGDRDTEVITKRTNDAYRACGSLAAATGNVMQKALADEAASSRASEGSGTETSDAIENLFNLTLWSIWLTEAQRLPAIELPAEAAAFTPAAWKYFQTYRLTGAEAFAEGAGNRRFRTIADLAIHIAHIPTGVHRFPLYVEDSPALYRFHRENFYPVMQSGDFDLLASFVDSLRQYGCTAENDMQVRDGTRHLLKAFHDDGDRWINSRDESEENASESHYDKIHRPWTAMLGLRDRKPLQPDPGTYGGIIRRWLPSPDE
jgi:hypothetical protein